METIQGMYNVITPEDDIYPEELLRLKNPPQELYCFGNLNLLKKRKVAIVGSRKFSNYGKWVAMTLGEKISNCDIVVVSGMAAGVDTCAHMGALKGIGKTIAVLGCGIDKCYPAINWRLKDQIAHEGLVISEYPPGTSASRWTFPKRNRIISALSDMVVVAEAGLNSGSLITAEIAMDMDKPVMAVPGNINNMYSIGSNKLISEGAMAVVVLDDVLQYLGVNYRRELDNIKLNPQEEEIYKCVSQRGEISIENICQCINKKPSYVNSIVTILEMKGIVYTCLGKVFVAK